MALQLVIVKPDGMKRSIDREVLMYLEETAHAHVLSCRKEHVDKRCATLLYQEHFGKPFYEELIEYITSAPVFVMCVDAEIDYIMAFKRYIRTKYQFSVSQNTMHSSDSESAGEREVSIFFNVKKNPEFILELDGTVYFKEQERAPVVLGIVDDESTFFILVDEFRKNVTCHNPKITVKTV